MRRLIIVLILTLVWSYGVNLTLVQAGEKGVFPPIAIGNGAPTVSIAISADKITVYWEGSTQLLLQEIPYNAAMLPELEDRERVIAEDMNFDGYLDLKIASSLGSANAYYSCWLWDSNGQNFVYHEQLSRLASPIFNPDVKTVYSFTHISAADSEETTYMWKGGRLWPVQIVERSYDADGDRLLIREYRLDEQGERRLVREQKLQRAAI